MNATITAKLLLSTWASFIRTSLFLVTIVPFGYGQVTVRNPQKPIKADSGRTVVLEEVCRLRDENGNTEFIKNPRYLSVLDDGSITFLDPPFLYKHDKDGRLIFKALKSGTGPGEYQHPGNYFFSDNHIMFQSWLPPKVLELDANGRYLREKKTPVLGAFDFLKNIENRIYGIRDDIRFSEFIYKEGSFDTPFTLYEIAADYQSMKKIFEIPVRHFIKKSRWWRRTSVDIAAYEHYLFIVHTAEYEISRLDLRSGRIDKVFKRPYNRLELSEYEVEQDQYDRVPKAWLPPPEKYAFDIAHLEAYKDTLWVFTSTSKDNDGVTGLIDVFSADGEYIDCFYLRFPTDNENHWFGTCKISNAGYVFTVLENRDSGLLSIAKYRVLNNIARRE